MAKTTKNTAASAPALMTPVSLPAPTTAQEVPATIEKLKQLLADLEGTNDATISTDICYTGNGSVNIKNVTEVTELLKISSSIRARSEAFEKEAEIYNMDGVVEKFSQDGKTAEQWYLIIGKAINELVNAVKIKNIKETIAELSEHLDAETRLKNTLANATNRISNLIK